MTNAARVGGIGVAVHDIPGMHRFYTETIGLTGDPLPDGAQHFVLDVGGVALAFFRTTGPMEHPRDIPRFRDNPTGLDHLRISISDLPALLDRLQAQGMRPVAIEGMTDGVVRLADPEGNLLGVQPL